MKLAQLISFFESIAPSELQETYDNAGLITGREDVEIKGVLVCLDAVEAVIDEAISLDCNVVVAHHPIVFKGLKRFNGSNYVEKTIIKAIKNDIAIFAIHTNLDNVLKYGVNEKIGRILSLQDMKILAPKKGNMYQGVETGAGLVGLLNQSMKAVDFLKHLKKCMGLEIVKHTAFHVENITKVAICGGSGSFLLQEAIKANADIFITADFKYHEFFDANHQIIITDIGHYESEKFTIELLYELIINNFSTFAAHCTKNVTNPIKYF